MYTQSQRCVYVCVCVCLCVEPYICETLSAEGSTQMNKDHQKIRVSENSLYMGVNPWNILINKTYRYINSPL
jgi:hypothetical protein